MIYFISKSNKDAGSSRHRAFFVADFLNKQGVSAEVIAPPDYLLGGNKAEQKALYLKRIFSITHDDVVVLQNLIRNKRLIFTLVMLRLFKRPRMIFDLDDASYTNWPIMTRILVWISDKVIVSSHHLAEWKGIGERPVLIMPNLVDYELADAFAVRGQKNSDMPILGWMGGAPDSLPNLRLLVPVFEKLIERKVRFVFRLVGSLYDEEVKRMFFAIHGLNVEFIEALDWQKGGEIQKVNAGFDVGLCPLTDTEDNRARCSLKILDYMAAGVPVVASPIGENSYFIENDKEGYLPRTTDEWAETLTNLIGNAELRNRLGAAAHEKLKTQFSYQANIGKYVDFLR